MVELNGNSVFMVMFGLLVNLLLVCWDVGVVLLFDKKEEKEYVRLVVIFYKVVIVGLDLFCFICFNMVLDIFVNCVVLLRESF